MKDVKGKVAVVTGAASGIGRGMAESFVDAGMKVVLSDIEQGALELTTRALRASGADVHAVVTDVSKPEQVEALAAQTLNKYGAVHVLCNNAGIGVSASPSWAGTLDDWSWILSVNLMSVIYGHRAFIPIMIEQGTEAHVVNTASLAGLVPGFGTLYAATKFAVVGLSESVYAELQQGGFKPKISVLCPGFVNTNILASERNRPVDLDEKSASSTGPMAELGRQWFAEQLKQGLSPRKVGDQVLAAIHDERFYILTHPAWNPMIEHRMKSILAGENPSPIRPPGIDASLQKLAALGDSVTR
jgi:NAD(P)-dependent dehydrogenase (short-subunit alcohol dehydrogenase family)